MRSLGAFPATGNTRLIAFSVAWAELAGVLCSAPLAECI
jgi:hypothetical protein